MYKTVIVDDELHGREELKHQLDAFNCFEIVAECQNAVDGVKAVNEYKPDVVFLDIQMPGLNGFEMLSMLEQENIPLVVFVTAYDEYAVQAFETNSLDYILKPIDPKRFLQTIERVKQSVLNDRRPFYDIKPLTKIPCSLNNVIKLVDVRDVDYVISDITGVHIITGDKNFLTDLTLKVLEERTDLFRCHRQYMISIDRVQEIRLLENGAGEVLTSGDSTVPVSRRLLKNLKQLVGIR